MQWLNSIVDELVKRHPDGEIIVSSGVSPSGKYHLGTLREVLTAEAVMRELKNRGRQCRHVHVVDDLDVFRKVPAGVPEGFEQHLGKPLCDVPAPDGSGRSYADYYLDDLLASATDLHLQMEVWRAHEQYRKGIFIPAIEKALQNLDVIRRILEEVAGRALDEHWSPVQVLEDGYLKNRKFIAIDTDSKELTYEDRHGSGATARYDNGTVKLNWRIDWPARWWLLGVAIEPFGRDHATKGGSYDTGRLIAEELFGITPPLPVPYNFINRTGETKKMSKSAGDTITAAELLKVLPGEIVWYFILRYAPDKLLFFDTGTTLIRLVDEFSELIAKQDKSEQEKQLLALCTYGLNQQTISSVPFSHLVTSYQAALKNPEKTLEVIRRTEHKETVDAQETVIKAELQFIDEWLKRWAPDDVKFKLQDSLEADNLTPQQKEFLADLASKIEQAPADADGEWFHKAIYEFKDEGELSPKELFQTLYQVLIGKDAGPRAGWFLASLDRDWLVKRLKLEA